MKYLKRIAEIRKQIEMLKAECEAIEPDAILEAFDILEANASPNGKSSVYSDSNAKIVLVLRNRYDNDNILVVKLNEDIDREYTKLCHANSVAMANNKAYIEELQEMISVAQAKYEALLVSVYLKQLRKEKMIAIKNTEHKVPSLSVYVKES